MQKQKKINYLLTQIINTTMKILAGFLLISLLTAVALNPSISIEFKTETTKEININFDTQLKINNKCINEYAPIIYRKILEMHFNNVPHPLPSVAIAQLAFETNFCQSQLFKKANNCCGLKAGNNWNGEVYKAYDDCKDKRNRKIKCKFKKFKHLEESIDAYFKTLQAERYKKQNIFTHTKTLDYEQQILGIKKAGYATSSEYARRINQFIQKHELYKYDIEYRNATLHNE